MSVEVCLKRFYDSEILGPGETKLLKKDIIAALEKQLGMKPEWKEGKSVDAESLPLGGFEALTQLQRYAAHLDLSDTPPELPAEDEVLYEDECLQEYWEVAESESPIIRPLRFKHLIWTGSVGLFYIPVEFPDPLLIEEEDLGDEEQGEKENEYISVGSANQLLNELDALRELLNLQGDYGDLGERVAKEIFDNKRDPWHEVKWAWLVLHWMARKSIEKRLSLSFE